MASVELPGVRLEYELGGTAGAARLLSISGSGSDLRHQPRVHDNPVLAERFEILAYDHRGLGRSVPDEPDRVPTMADFAADAIGLLDHVGWETAHVCGVSFGGMVAQELAVTAPERIERLALVCTSPGGAGGSSSPLHTLADLPPDERLAQQVAWIDDRTVEDAELRAFWIEMMAGFVQSEQSEGMRLQLEARRDHDVWDRLPALRLPVLIAAGRYDGIAVPANQEALLRQIEGAELRWFDGGHGFFLTEPEALPAVADWLASA